MKVLQAIVCEGVYQDKPYKCGRLFVGQYKANSLSPAWVQVLKCPPEIAVELQKKTPCDVTLYYDNYKNVVSYKNN